MSSSRFWSRKKKTKSVSGASDLAESSNGTWPRLDSPSIANVLTGGGGGKCLVTVDLDSIRFLHKKCAVSSAFLFVHFLH